MKQKIKNQDAFDKTAISLLKADYYEPLYVIPSLRGIFLSKAAIR